MTSQCSIRAAVSADIEAVADLDRRTQNVPHWSVADYLAALSPADGPGRAPGTRRCFFVAEAWPEIVGFAVGRVTVLEAEVLAELESVAVAESLRRAGIGRALCGAVIAWARRQGAAQIELEVRSRSYGPIALYNSLGFVTAGVRPGYYRDPADDAVLMRLALSDERPSGATAGRDL